MNPLEAHIPERGSRSNETVPHQGGPRSESDSKPDSNATAAHNAGPAGSVDHRKDGRNRETPGQSILGCQRPSPRYTSKTATAAGVTPGMRPACPRVAGRTRLSFCTTSVDKPGIS